ncbi:MAG: tRNA pseudouridine(38-40) synthase TruA [Planctomycetota bacterium]|nr:tRNA pseudouridine(38-40) synthase TruA [Planctomycetota bacterium]
MASKRRPAPPRKDLAPGELARAPTYKLEVEYEGTRYSGWQEQKNARTVAGVLRAAIEDAAGDVLDLGGAGRTDAGVHALAQVAHLKLAKPMDPAALAVAVNERLPADVNLLAVTRAPQRFHARHDAQSRSYVFQIARRRSAFAHQYSWWVDGQLDVNVMRAAQATLVGERDFAPFGQESPGQTVTTVRLDRAEIAEHGALVVLRFEASHFLWRMVRRLTGALVKVGTGAITPAHFAQLLAGGTLPAKFGTIAEWTAPSTGLFLERVRYKGDPPLGDLVPPIAIANFGGRAEKPSARTARPVVDPKSS